MGPIRDAMLSDDVYSKWPPCSKLCCSTGDGGRGSQRYHPQNGSVLFSGGLRTSHIHVLRVTVLNKINVCEHTASSGFVHNEKETEFISKV